MQSQLQRRADPATRHRHVECAPSAAQSGGLGVVVRAALVAVGDDREEAVVADCSTTAQSANVVLQTLFDEYGFFFFLC